MCIKCYQGYFVKLGKCVQVNPICMTYNNATGACLTCYPGYGISGDNCTIAANPSKSDVNCKTYDNTQSCTQCYQGYYLSRFGSCDKLNPLCKTYVINTNNCDSCYNGYAQSNGNCVVATNIETNVNDPYCIQVQNGYCYECAAGYYLGAQNLCLQLNPLCKSSNLTTGKCTVCYSGYTLTNGDCQITQQV